MMVHFLSCKFFYHVLTYTFENVRLPKALPTIIIIRLLQNPIGMSAKRTITCEKPSAVIHIQKYP